MINKKSSQYAAYRAIGFSVSLRDQETRRHQTFSYRHFERSEKSFLQSDKRCTSPHFPALFHAACALSAPSGHLPLEGKADDTREPAIKSPSGIASIYTSRRFHILCAAPPFLISHFSFLIRAKLSSAIHGRGAHGLTLNLHSPISHTLPCHLSSVER